MSVELLVARIALAVSFLVAGAAKLVDVPVPVPPPRHVNVAVYGRHTDSALAAFEAVSGVTADSDTIRSARAWRQATIFILLLSPDRIIILRGDTVNPITASENTESGGCARVLWVWRASDDQGSAIRTVERGLNIYARSLAQ